jgi:diguanylate cyclase (GGDEF)-like protein
MSGSNRPSLWLVLVGGAALLALAIACVLIGVTHTLNAGFTAVLCAGFGTFASAGWFQAHAQRRRALRAERTLATRPAATAALHDPLTALASHRLFDVMLRSLLARAQRYGHPFSVLLIELEPVGEWATPVRTVPREHVLKYLGTILQSNLREADMPARLSNTLFGVAMCDTDYAGAQCAWERVRQTAFAQWPEHRWWSLSGGAAAYDIDTGSVENLLAEAHRRLALEKRRLRTEPEP